MSIYGLKYILIVGNRANRGEYIIIKAPSYSIHFLTERNVLACLSIAKLFNKSDFEFPLAYKRRIYLLKDGTCLTVLRISCILNRYPIL